MTVAELIERLRTMPQDAEIRVTQPTDEEKQVNSPARDVTLQRIGPLVYVEVV
jgi:hypothetical protein